MTVIAESVLAQAVAPFEHLTTTPPDTVIRYARDPFAYCDDGIVTILNLGSLQPVPLVPWPHQRAFTGDWINLDLLRDTGTLEFRNVHEEKSRKEGMSWWIAYLVWWLLKHHEAPGGYQHMDIEEVDDGGCNNTVKSFFGRIRWINAQLEERHRAPLLFRGKNAPSVRHAYRPLAFVIGEGHTPDPARGQQLRWFVQDEAARLPHDKAAVAALSSAVPTGLVMNSTPMGEDNEYFRIRKERPKGWRMRRDHWSTHPVYGQDAHIAGSRPNDCPQCHGNLLRLRWTPANPDVAHRYPGKMTSPWYDTAVVPLTDEHVAQELDIDYSRSLEARVYPEFSEEVHVAAAAEIAARGLDPLAPWDEAVYGYELAWDYGVGTTAIGIFQDAPREWRMIGQYEIGDTAPEEVVAGLRDVLADLGVPLALTRPPFSLDMLGVGDPSGEAREKPTARSIVSDYYRLGFRIRSRRERNIRTINALKGVLLGRPKPLVVFEPTCGPAIDHFKNNRWPTDRQGRRKPGNDPLNDRHNHLCFVAGTMIATARGSVPIEQVRRGELVLTRRGWQRVSGCGPTGIRRVWAARHERGEVIGTGDHPIWVRSEGWVPLRNLDPSMEVYVIGEPSEQDGATAREREVRVEAQGSGVTLARTVGVRANPRRWVSAHATRVRGRPNELPGEHLVFNLTVEGEPEFFANGVLVHNCRAVAYLATWKFPPVDVDAALADAAAAKAEEIERKITRPTVELPADMPLDLADRIRPNMDL